ncbi:MAG: nucleotidyltransferase [Clostridia bacterium]|nr:nucleotidyltransferase [Clostridia bacterium]
MKTAVIICEYNPFHNGHKFQIDEVKKEYNAVICIMSGSFVQRGDIAIYDKWTRAEAALLNGADLVIELPVCYALNTAERFAYGGVFLANSLGIADALYFGSESGDIERMKAAVDLLTNEPENISNDIKNLVSSGMTYAKAREISFSKLIPSSLLSEPNNILGLEYIKALKQLKSTIQPKTIKRVSSHYHETEPTSNSTSATAIRKIIKNNINYSVYVPESANKLYENASIADIEKLNTLLVYLIRTKSSKEISEINEVCEGLENRIISSVKYADTFTGICDYVKSKRYTLSKIRRIMMSLILNIDKSFSFTNPQYVRILGMNETGINLLSEIKKHSPLPIITKAADFKGKFEQLEKDILSTDIHSLCTDGEHTIGLDYLKSPIILK